MKIPNCESILLFLYTESQNSNCKCQKSNNKIFWLFRKHNSNRLRPYNKSSVQIVYILGNLIWLEPFKQKLYLFTRSKTGY